MAIEFLNRNPFENVDFFESATQFMQEEGRDLLKLAGNLADIAAKTISLDGQRIESLIAFARVSTKIFADGALALKFPESISAYYMHRPSDHLDEQIVKIANIAKSGIKLLKFGHEVKAWSLDLSQATVSLLQNGVGIVEYGSSAIKDIRCIRKNYSAHREEAAYQRTSRVAAYQGGIISLLSNVTRVGLNALALGGGVLGIALSSPLMLALSTAGTVASIASYYFKNKSETVGRAGRREGELILTAGIQCIENNRETMLKKIEAVENVIQNPALQGEGDCGKRGRKAIGEFLAFMHHESIDQVFFAISGVHGQIPQGNEISFGRFVIRDGKFLDRREVQDAILSACQGYRAAHPPIAV